MHNEIDVYDNERQSQHNTRGPTALDCSPETWHTRRGLFDVWLKSFNDIFIFSIGAHFVQLSRTIRAVSVEGITRNISVKIFRIGPVVQEEMLFKDMFYL